MLTVIVVSSCNDDNNDGNGTSAVVNTNKNPAPYEALQFPKVKGGKSDIIVHTTTDYGFTYGLEWDHTLKAQRWTCFFFTDKNRVKNWYRNQWKSTTWGGDPFQKDPSVPSAEQPEPYGEFSGSSYPDKGFSYFQRGHICPSEDRVCSQEANEQTFYMTNMFPQGENFNTGIWENMESFVRNNWGRKTTGSDTLFVVKGGTIDRENDILCRTRSGFIVPRYFFMALLLKKNTSYQAMGFWVEHLSSDHSADLLNNYVVNIRELEQKTGIDFFCNQPDNIEEQVETQSVDIIKRLWNLTNH